MNQHNLWRFILNTCYDVFMRINNCVSIVPMTITPLSFSDVSVQLCHCATVPMSIFYFSLSQMRACHCANVILLLFPLQMRACHCADRILQLQQVSFGRSHKTRLWLSPNKLASHDDKMTTWWQSLKQRKRERKKNKKQNKTTITRCGNWKPEHSTRNRFTNHCAIFFFEAVMTFHNVFRHVFQN